MTGGACLVAGEHGRIRIRPRARGPRASGGVGAHAVRPGRQKAAWCVWCPRHVSTLPAEAKWMALGRAGSVASCCTGGAPPHRAEVVTAAGKFASAVVGTSSRPGAGRRAGIETAGRAAAATRNRGGRTWCGEAGPVNWFLLKKLSAPAASTHACPSFSSPLSPVFSRTPC